MSRNGVIGRDGGLPWHLPADLAHFRTLTMGKPVLMGRRTYQSIGKPLPGRTNLVLTREPAWRAEGVLAVHSIDEALAAVPAAAEIAGIGGADVFAALLPLAERIHLTRVEADIPGDTHFPAVDFRDWQESACVRRAADTRNAYDLTFVTLQRAGGVAR